MAIRKNTTRRAVGPIPGPRLVLASAVLLAGLAGLAGLASTGSGCNKNGSADQALPTARDRDTDVASDRGPGAGSGDKNQAKGNAPMSGTQGDIDLVKDHYARELHIDSKDIKVTVQKDVPVPGITVFAASANPARAGRHVRRNGIVEGGAIYSEGEAMMRVARAWGYGARRTVSATDFATVMGFLYSATEGVAPIIDDDTLDVFRSTAYPKQAAAAALPREITVDGLPAVEFCITSGARAIPFTVVTAVVKPDFQVDLRKRPIMNE